MRRGVKEQPGAQAYIAVDAELRERSIDPVGDISAIFGRAARSTVILGLEREIFPLAEVREKLVQKPRAMVRPAVHEGVDDIREVPFSEHAAFDDISDDFVDLFGGGCLANHPGLSKRLYNTIYLY